MLISSDLHIHTLRSGHAFNTIDECVKKAAEMQLKCIGISDHGPTMEGAPHLGYFEVLSRLPEYICGVETFYGCEANILDIDGTIDVSDEICDLLNYVMAGLHKRTPYNYNSCCDNTKAIIKTMQSRKVHIISHPFRNEFPVDIYDIVHCAKENNIILEINKVVFVSAAKRKDKVLIEELIKMLALIKETQTMCLFGSDAHYISEMGINQDEWDLMDNCFNISQIKFINDEINVYLKNKKV